MDVVKFYNNMRNTTVGLPEWNALHPQYQHQVVNAVNALLSVMYAYDVKGKETQEKPNATN